MRRKQDKKITQKDIDSLMANVQKATTAVAKTGPELNRATEADKEARSKLRAARHELTRAVNRMVAGS